MVRVFDFGAVAGDGIDDPAAPQAAIDAAAAPGASTVSLPNGAWTLMGEVTLSGSIARLTGTQATITGEARSAW